MNAYVGTVMASLLVAYALADTPMRPPTRLLGFWRGIAKTSIVGSPVPPFPVFIRIHADGSVTGTVGNATLSDASFFRHRPRDVTREQRHDVMDYMIRGRLVGPLVAAKRVFAAEVFIPLDEYPGKFEAAVHAHGTKIAGQPDIFSADLVLVKFRP